MTYNLSEGEGGGPRDRNGLQGAFREAWRPLRLSSSTGVADDLARPVAGRVLSRAIEELLVATQRKSSEDPTSERQDLTTTVLTPEETVRFDAALRGEDGWAPNRRLSEAVERHNKAIAEGRLRAK